MAHKNLLGEGFYGETRGKQGVEVLAIWTNGLEPIDFGLVHSNGKEAKSGAPITGR